MENFIFPIRLEKELKNFLDFPEKIPRVLCFYGIPAQGKTSFAKYLAEQVAVENIYFDANSHSREGHDSSYVVKQITKIDSACSVFCGNKAFDKCYIIDEWHDFSTARQDDFKTPFDTIIDEDNKRCVKNLVIICLNTDSKKTIEKVLTTAIFSRCHPVRFDILASEKDDIIQKTIKKFPELDPAIIKRSIPDWRVIKRALKML